MNVAYFWSLVEKTDTCWLWRGRLDKDGYGIYSAARAHRVAYKLVNGSIPEGQTLDHVRERGCTHRHCVNPAHLEPVPHRVNTLRGTGFPARNAALTHCIRGHPFSPENTRVQVNPTHTKRICRTCEAERTRAYLARKKAA